MAMRCGDTRKIERGNLTTQGISRKKKKNEQVQKKCIMKNKFCLWKEEVKKTTQD